MPDDSAIPIPSSFSPTGLLVVDKPIGMSSMHVCRIVRRRLVNAGAPKRVKVGHAGSLDPLATGVLIILIGRATRLCESIMHGRKRYVATVDLAHRSDTHDYEGTLEPVAVEHPPTRDQVAAALARFVGPIQQTPPIHSALKIAGESAYKRARRGEDIQMKPRTITIHAIDLIDYDFPTLTIDVACGRGTYIRSLARDIGVALDTGGTLASLRRTAVGPFLIDHAKPIDGGVPDPLTQSDLIPMDSLNLDETGDQES